MLELSSKGCTQVNKAEGEGDEGGSGIGEEDCAKARG